jgi:hypothetical protein
MHDRLFWKIRAEIPKQIKVAGSDASKKEKACPGAD